MPKVDFIHPEWARTLERASRAADTVPLFEERLINLERYLMATYDDLKREVAETRDSVRAVVAKIGETAALLRDAQARIEAGQSVDYSELTASLDEAQAEIAGAMSPTPAIEEVAAQTPEAPVEPPPAEGPAEPTG